LILFAEEYYTILAQLVKQLEIAEITDYWSHAKLSVHSFNSCK